MPERETVQQLLARHHGVRFVTPIYQSDDDSIGGGVCRGVAARWIGAHIGGVIQNRRSVTDFRRVATNTNGTVALELKQFHAAFEYVGDEFAKARALYEAKREERDLIVAQRNGTVSMWFWQSLPTLQDEQRAEREFLELQGKAVRKAQALMRYMAGGLVEMTKLAVVPYAQLVARVSNAMPNAGYYYMGPTTHAIAFYFDPNGECLFLDANTGEWAIRSPRQLDAFFTDYMNSLYDTTFANTNFDRYYVNQACSDGRHFVESEADYSNIDLGTLFG